MNATITLNEYLNKKKTFVIPDYQRGYIWGKKRSDDEYDSVTHLLQTILNGFKCDAEVFLQGITVSEQKEKAVIIDGQQRTTCLYLLLKYLQYPNTFSIEYDIRSQSNLFLQSLNNDKIKEIAERTKETEEFQDIYFFKKTLRIIVEQIDEIDKKELLEYMLSKIKFLYINIPDPNQAMKVFTMMNGNKAQMKEEEIIKAEILRLASLENDINSVGTKNFYANEWDNNMLRSRYAREWDKWLHWWNREGAQKMFRCSNTMGLLLSAYSNNEKEVKFEWFKKQFLKENIAVNAKKTFDQLRRLQKRFEDAFNNPITYNMIGAILRIFDRENASKFIEYYFKNDNKSNLILYYRLAFLNLTHKEIIDHLDTKNTQVFDEKYEKMLNAISDDFVYTNINNEDKMNCKECAFRLLLRLNIDEDCKQEQQNGIKGRKFDFSIWTGNRSLEHIYPKSKVLHRDDEGKTVDGNGESREKNDTCILRDDIKYNDVVTTEHSIGNLVLLYKNENSAFNNNLFEEKKAMFFDPSNKEYFNSRHLLHTIYAFAKSQWIGENIAQGKKEIITNFKNYYGK